MYSTKKYPQNPTATVNGVAIDLPVVMSIADLLAGRGLAGKRIAVERNGEIVPRSEHPNIKLTDGDRIEIVIAVGGG